MTNKEIYSTWCQTQLRLPIFMQPWWLDAVCAGKEWDVMLILNHDLGTVNDLGEDDIVAAMPYLLRKRWGMRYIIMPQQTQLGGIWLEEKLGLKGEDWWSKVCQIAANKLQAMNLAYYYQQFPIHNPCPPVLKALGFKVKDRITYRILDLNDLDRVIAAFSKNKRRQLQKALSLHVEHGMEAEEFYRFHKRCMLEQKKHISYSREFLLVLDRKTRRLGQSEIIRICNADGEIYAAAFVVWDNRRMYYLIPCYSALYKDSGASALLVLEALKLARQKGVQFDFEGSNERGIANHYKQFGSEPYHYCSVSKVYRPIFYIALLFNWLRNIRYHL